MMLFCTQFPATIRDQWCSDVFDPAPHNYHHQTKDVWLSPPTTIKRPVMSVLPSSTHSHRRPWPMMSYPAPTTIRDLWCLTQPPTPIRDPWCPTQSPTPIRDPWCLTQTPTPIGDPWCLTQPPTPIRDPWCPTQPPTPIRDPWCLTQPPTPIRDPWCPTQPPYLMWVTRGVFLRQPP